MPLRYRTIGGKRYVQWGKSGKMYPYDVGSESSKKAAVKKALAQAAAMGEFEDKKKKR